jgi:uncharacterized protein (TIGR02452 family)
MNRSKRVLIAQATLKILKKGHYKSPSGKEIILSSWQQSAESNTIWYTPESIENLKPEEFQTFETQFEVHNQTTQQAAERLHDQGETRLLALNFASAKNPGGGFLNGSQAQEESLARSSGLYPCLLQHKGFYDLHRERKNALYTDNMLYSPDVPFIRNDNGELLEKPYLMSIITSPAVNAGAVKRNLPQEDVNRMPELMLSRTEKVLRVAAFHQHEVLILGAWGCGVFRNDPKEIASYFAHFLLENGAYKNRFRKIVFAVLDRTKDQANINAFKSFFK